MCGKEALSIPLAMHAHSQFAYFEGCGTRSQALVGRCLQIALENTKQNVFLTPSSWKY